MEPSARYAKTSGPTVAPLASATFPGRRSNEFGFFWLEFGEISIEVGSYFTIDG